MINERFYVTDHNFSNTGGGCMVSVFAVYDSTDNVTRFVMANDEGFNWQTADTINAEGPWLDSDEAINAILLGNWQWDALTSEPCWDQHQFTDDEFELFKYCQFEFYKKYCAYFKSFVSVPVEWLPNTLFNELSEDARDWLKENGEQVWTNGVEVSLPDSWTDYQRQSAKRELKKLLRTFNELATEEIPETFKLEILGSNVELPIHGDNYEIISNFLRDLANSL